MFVPEDPSWIQPACDRAEMARFIPGLPSPFTFADAEAFVRYAQDAWKQGSGAPFAISATDGQPLGAVEVHLNPTDDGRAVVGYWLRPEARGQGAATEAVRLVSTWAFDQIHIERLSLMTYPANEASQRVAARAGYKREGLLRAWYPTPLGRRDCVMFSLLPSDVSPSG
jgi:RimJ/RimL family protein N-acetyltransferase